MNQEIDLTKIERKAYLTYHQDGVMDIILGCGLLLAAVSMLSSNPSFVAVMIAPFLFLGGALKKKITQPRLGYVKFSPIRQEKEKKKKFALILLFTFTTLLGLLVFLFLQADSPWQDYVRSLKLLPLGFVLCLTIGALGIIHGTYRLVVYAALILIFFIAGHIFHSDPPAYFLALGLIFLISGIIILIRFMRKYPLPPKEERIVG